jgi:hypothetical protein
MTKARDLANIISGGFDATDIPNLDTSKITTGTFADARMPSTVLNSNVDLTNLSASNLTSGTLPDARFPATLPAISGANLTNIQGGTNTPAFFAFLSSSQDLSQSTTTKLNMGNEQFDTDSAYDSTTNYRFTVPTGKAGKYVVQGHVNAYSSNDDDKLNYVYARIYKNGTQVLAGSHLHYYSGYQYSAYVNGMLDLSEDDYLELYGTVWTDGATIPRVTSTSYFGAYKLIT